MKALLLLASASLITMLNAGHVVQEKNIHVVSSHPVYERIHKSDSKHHTKHDDRVYRDDRYHRYSEKPHRRHIVGYNNIGYYKGMKIVKQSHVRLHHFPIEISIRF